MDKKAGQDLGEFEKHLVKQGKTLRTAHEYARAMGKHFAKHKETLMVRARYRKTEATPKIAVEKPGTSKQATPEIAGQRPDTASKAIR